MIALKVELLHHTIRANGGAHTGQTGAAGAEGGEWPPSPARVVSALVSGGGTSEWNRIGSDDSEVRCFETAGAPEISAADESEVVRADLRARFVVVDERHTKGAVQNYPARKAATTRPGVRITPRNPVIVYRWPELDLSRTEVEALRRRCARVGYLGCADSPVRMSVAEHHDQPESTDFWRPDRYGATTVRIPEPGYVDSLDEAHRAFLEHANPRWHPNAQRLEPYRTPSDPQTQQPELIWIRFGRPVSGRRVVLVADTLRRAVLRRYEDLVGPVPPVLLGHGLERGQQHARFWPLPDVGFRHSSGRLFGAAIWLPPGTDQAVVDGTKMALWGVEQLFAGHQLEVGVQLHEGAARPLACSPQRWVTTAERWVTAFPAVHERHTRGTPSDADVARWCTNAGLPEPIGVLVSREPFVKGAAALRPHETVRSGKRVRPYSHVALRFGQRVRGPFAIGAGRSFGLGLMVPFSQRSREGRS